MRALAAVGRVFAAAGCLLALASAIALAQLAPTRTATPAPKLSGGFGRPRNTPAAAGDGGGQSLADVVRAAKQPDSPSHEKSGVTIDNHSLVTSPDKGRVSTSKASPARPAPSAPKAAQAGEPTAAAPAPGSAGDEAEWRAMAQSARKRAADAKTRVDELTASTRKLENDFYAWDDGQYRDRVIKPAWDKTRDQLEDATRDLAAAQKDLDELPEKARRAGAQPGWIRE